MLGRTPVLSRIDRHLPLVRGCRTARRKEMNHEPDRLVLWWKRSADF